LREATERRELVMLGGTHAPSIRTLPTGP
jgi:hypothetical protein